MLAGKKWLHVTWFVDATNGWATSTAYATNPVLPFVPSSTPADGSRWDRCLDPVGAVTILGSWMTAIGERPKSWMDATFPHPLAGAPGTAEGDSPELWKCSPFGGCLSRGLCNRASRHARWAWANAGLSIFSAWVSPVLDCVGHDFGPDSAEVHDMVLDWIIRSVASSKCSIKASVVTTIWSACRPITGCRRSTNSDATRGDDAGQGDGPRGPQGCRSAMVAAHGPARTSRRCIRRTSRSRQRLEQWSTNPRSARPAIEAVSKMPGILRVISGPGAGPRRRPAVRTPWSERPRSAISAAESGDLVFACSGPTRINGDASAASHGRLNAYDQKVPSSSIRSTSSTGRDTIEESTADIVPRSGRSLD